MTEIRHHLPDDLLMGYSAGTLPEAFSLVVATHVSMCDDCRAALAGFDAIGGALLDAALPGDAARPVAMDKSSLAATLARIGAAPDAPPPDPGAARDVPAPLAEYLGGGLEAVRWRPVGMGVKQAILRTSRAASARMLFIPAGTAVPDHGHRGRELTLVLRGAFEDAEDRFGVGDVECADESLEHTPVADIAGDCICLAATDAPLRFRGLLPRLAQPFLRI